MTTQPEPEKRVLTTPTVAAILPGGELVEMVYDPVARTTQFVCGTAAAWGYESSLSPSPAERLVPYSPQNNLIRHGVVLFPSEPVEYGNEADLLARVRSFIHRYVDVSPEFEEIATYYVLFTWVFDAYDEVPFVRVRGDYGSGKTRFLLTVGSLCYRPIFASAASTVSPLFRLMDAFKGTLILDEGDFRYSDTKAEIVKILNQGSSRGFPVLRTEVNRNKEFDPRAYNVFGPKIAATRGFFEDRALESRCLTEPMGRRRMRTDVPLNLDDRHREESLALRNQLLLFRLRNYGKMSAPLPAGGRDIEPRLEQLFGPLLTMVADPAARERVTATLRRMNEELTEERSETVEAQVLTVIRDLVAKGPDTRLGIQDITNEFVRRHGDDYARRVTPRWMGSIIRRRLGFRASRSTGIFTLNPEELTRMKALLLRFGIPPAIEGNTAEEAKPDTDA